MKYIITDLNYKCRNKTNVYLRSINRIELSMDCIIYRTTKKGNMNTGKPKNKNTNPFDTPRKQDDAARWIRTPSVILGRELSLDWLSREGQPMGEIPEVMWLEEQSSEVLYDTYHHGLPFNQRVERKDKVKLSSPFRCIIEKTQAMKTSHKV